MTQHPVPRDRSFAPGAVILCEDTVAQHLYIVKRGRVKVVKRSGGGEAVLGELGPGNLFGEMALIDHRPRSASVIAIEPTVCIELPCLLVEDLLTQANPWVSALLRILVLRLRIADDTVAGLRARSGDSGEVPVDKITERHLRRIVKSLDDPRAAVLDRLGAEDE
jgi:CRP/FNR family cyclic AMP-dependent transcriptional regulator